MVERKAILEVKDLSVKLPAAGDREMAIAGVTFALHKAETLCIVGESGSGKSVTAFTIAGLLSDRLKPVHGSIHFAGQNLLELGEAQWRALRGARIAMIFQEPMTALNPLLRCGTQIAEVFEAHGKLKGASLKAKVLDLLHEVGLPDPSRAYQSFPHELSGGQRQRVMIAMALALEPDILIADEPTTALDVTTQAQILALLKNLQRKHGTAILFITHDFGVVADIADTVLVMNKGLCVESGRAADVLAQPKDDYTKALLAAVPRASTEQPETPRRSAPILRVTGLSKSYSGRGHVVRALDGVAFELAAGETLGIVGESGSGKSTLGKALLRLIDCDSGEVSIDGQNIHELTPQAMRASRSSLQMVFQDPYSSLNPKHKIRRIISAGPMIHGVSAAEANQRAEDLIELVGLEQWALERYPHEFSGGQRQRIGLARALALEPRIVVADEPVSALDVSVQAQVLRLLASLKDRLNLSLIFITHDLRVASQICDRVAVMSKGRIVEQGPTAEVFANPKDSYTQRLLAALPGQKHALFGARRLR